MIVHRSIASETGLWLFERSARSASSSIWACGSITRSLSRRPRARPAEHHEVVGEDAEAHPPLHPGEAAIPAATQAVAPLQDANATFRASAPSQRGSIAARAAFSAVSRQDDVTHLVIARRLLIGARGETAIRDRQTRRPSEELLVSDQRRFPQRLIRHPGRTDRVVGDELGLGLLDLDELAELGRLGRLALADSFGVGFEDAEHFVGIVGVAAQHPSPGLGHDPPDEADRLAEAVAQPSDRGPGMEATDPLRGLGLPEDAPRDPQQPPVELAHPGLAALPNLVA